MRPLSLPLPLPLNASLVVRLSRGLSWSTRECCPSALASSFTLRSVCCEARRLAVSLAPFIRVAALTAARPGPACVTVTVCLRRCAPAPLRFPSTFSTVQYLVQYRFRKCMFARSIICYSASSSRVLCLFFIREFASLESGPSVLFPRHHSLLSMYSNSSLFLNL